MALVTTCNAWGKERGYFIEVSRSQVDQVSPIFLRENILFLFAFLKISYTSTPKKKKKPNRLFPLWCHLTTVLRPESSFFFLSYLNLVIPVRFE